MPSTTKIEKQRTGQARRVGNARDLALSVTTKLLKAEGSSIELERLAEELSVSQENLIEVLNHLEEGKIVLRTDDSSALVIPSGEERLKLAIAAVTFGAGIEESAAALSWKEFEAFCTKVLEANGYSCMHEFRFKSTKGRRYECDVVAISKPMILIADCKHYGGRVTALRAVVKKQLERVGSASKNMSTIIRKIPQIVGWAEAVMVPVIITLFPENIAMVDDVPIVPAFKLNQFVQEFPSNIEIIKNIRVKPSKQRRLIQDKWMI